MKNFLLSALMVAIFVEGSWAQSKPPEVADLPLIELPANSRLPFFVVFLSSDGGWADLDRQISTSFVINGISVVGLNSLRYFWTRRTPEEASADLVRVLDHYLGVWGKMEAVLVGYSRGADVLPFMASRLPPARRKQVRLLALLGPATAVQFDSVAADCLRIGAQGPVLPLLPELEKLEGLNILCFYGSDEKDTLCRDIDPRLAQCIALADEHHFGGSYRENRRPDSGGAKGAETVKAPHLLST